MSSVAWMPASPSCTLSTEKGRVSQGPLHNYDYSNSFIFLTCFHTVCSSPNYQMQDKKEPSHQTSVDLPKHTISCNEPRTPINHKHPCEKGTINMKYCISFHLLILDV